MPDAAPVMAIVRATANNWPPIRVTYWKEEKKPR